MLYINALFNFTEKFRGNEPQELDEIPEKGNSVHMGEFGEAVTRPETGNIGYSPFFNNMNSLNRLVAKPSGNMIKLKCQAKGDPEPTIQWTKDNLPIERKMGQIQYSKWAITLEDLIPDDSGAYTCKVCNVHGCTNFTTKVEVTGK